MPMGVAVGVAVGVKVIVGVEVVVEVKVVTGVEVKVVTGVKVEVREDVMVGMGVMVRVEVGNGIEGVIGVDDAMGALDVREGPTPGRITFPSRTLYPSSPIRLCAVDLIVEPKADKVPINTMPTKTAISAYSTSPCPFSRFFVENNLFILCIRFSFREFEIVRTYGVSRVDRQSPTHAS